VATPPAPKGDAVLVEFGRSGGIAGVIDQLTVGKDGSFALVRKHPGINITGHLSTSELADLRKVLEDCHFAQLPKVQPAKGNDLFTYQIIYGGNQIVAMDGGMVPALKPVVSNLSGLVVRYSG
jgi:hypothetical protein